jgi:hypothetical protein
MTRGKAVERGAMAGAFSVLLGLARRMALALVVSVAVSLIPGLARAGEVRATPVDAPEIERGGIGPLPTLPVTYQVEKLGWWTLAYPASARERVRPLVEKADAWKAQLAADFGQDVLAQPIEVRIARSWDDMATLVPRGVGVPAYAAGVTYGSLRLVVLTLTEPSGGEATDLETVFRHELSHVALEDALTVAGDGTSGGSSERGTMRSHVPRWFNEGLAVHESGELAWLRMRTLWDATLFRQLLPFSDLDRAFASGQGRVDLAYAESADIVAFLLRGKERQRFVSLIERLRGGEPFDHALGDAYGTDVRKLEYEWREECAKRNTFAPMLASGSFVWVVAFGALVVGYQRRKRATQATLARWEKEEALSALPASVAREDEPPFTDPARALAGLPKIEHDGDWHTLH